MRLALQTDYALRTLKYAATRGERVKAADVSAVFGMTAAHISKVVNQLGRLGYVRSIRGIGGGFELSRTAEEISVGEVVVAFEGNMHLLDCVTMQDVCVIESFCKLKKVLTKAEQVQYEYLRGVTLADVLPTKRQIAKQEIGKKQNSTAT
jgi:Rrf2 family nitric oxide-sensitive transcriptional repressor